LISLPRIPFELFDELFFALDDKEDDDGDRLGDLIDAKVEGGKLDDGVIDDVGITVAGAFVEGSVEG